MTTHNRKYPPRAQAGHPAAGLGETTYREARRPRLPRIAWAVSGVSHPHDHLRQLCESPSPRPLAWLGQRCRHARAAGSGTTPTGRNRPAHRARSVGDAAPGRRTWCGAWYCAARPYGADTEYRVPVRMARCRAWPARSQSRGWSSSVESAISCGLRSKRCFLLVEPEVLPGSRVAVLRRRPVICGGNEIREWRRECRIVVNFGGEAHPRPGLAGVEQPEPGAFLGSCVFHGHDDGKRRREDRVRRTVRVTLPDRLVEFLLLDGGLLDPFGHDLDRRKQRAVMVAGSGISHTARSCPATRMASRRLNRAAPQLMMYSRACALSIGLPLQVAQPQVDAVRGTDSNGHGRVLKTDGAFWASSRSRPKSGPGSYGGPVIAHLDTLTFKSGLRLAIWALQRPIVHWRVPFVPVRGTLVIPDENPAPGTEGPPGPVTWGFAGVDGVAARLDHGAAPGRTRLSNPSLHRSPRCDQRPLRSPSSRPRISKDHEMAANQYALSAHHFSQRPEIHSLPKKHVINEGYSGDRDVM